MSLERATDAELLGTRLRDLPISIEGSELGERVEQLEEELDAAGFRFRPHVWLSSDWFAPREAPGFAIPFYLAHPRLKRLEKKMMLEVEGGSRRECMKILRHEAGHAFQVAYQLHRRRRWRELFGSSSQPYPESYLPKPHSRSYVLHIRPHYAQAHPDEDFAETFAVWLAPGSGWRKRYERWPALRKLEYVDELMKEIAQTPPKERSRRRIDPLSSLNHTVEEHYRRRHEHYGVSDPDMYTRDLRRLFPGEAGDEKSEPAARFLKRVRRDTLRAVAAGTGQYQYTINDLYQEMIDRSEEQGLRLSADADRETLRADVAVFLTVLAMNRVAEGGHWIKL